MAADENFFARELRAYYLEQGKNLSETLTAVLNKSLEEMSDEEKGVYEKVVLPTRERIKQALAERLRKPGANRQEWMAKLQDSSHTVIGQIANEMLSETEGPQAQPSIDVTPDAGQPESSPQLQQETKTFCTKCGSENPLGNLFCGKCGGELQKATPQAPAPASAPFPQHPIVSTPPYPIASAGSKKKLIVIALIGLAVIVGIIVVIVLATGGDGRYGEITKPIMDKLNTMDSYLDVGITKIEYGEEVRDLKAIYDDFVRQCSDKDKKRKSYSLIGEAVDEYIAAMGSWESYIDAPSYEEDDYELEMQMHWLDASTAIESAKAAIESDN